MYEKGAYKEPNSQEIYVCDFQPLTLKMKRKKRRKLLVGNLNGKAYSISRFPKKKTLPGRFYFFRRKRDDWKFLKHLLTTHWRPRGQAYFRDIVIDHFCCSWIVMYRKTVLGS